MQFDKLHQKIDKSNLLVFFDLEGTQINHKAIAIGLVAYEKEKKSIDFSKKRIDYHAYIKTDEKIGYVVQKMTGITKPLLDKEGKNIHQVILEITSLLRHYSKSYISYGNLDIQILANSLSQTDETEMNFFRNVTKNYLDFHSYLEERVCDEKGQSFSVSKLSDLFNIKQEGQLHNPWTDALLLSKIYQFYIENENQILALFKKNILKNPNAISIYKELTALILAKGYASSQDFDEILRSHL